MHGRMSLTMGPLLFNWSVEKRRDFYARIADEAPIDIVCLGEAVCSKRLPFYQDELREIGERLHRGGKKIVLSSLALITLPQECATCLDITCNEMHEIEVNDITALAYHQCGKPFRVGPFVNVYNEGTLQFLAKQGALSVCLPPELPISDISKLAEVGRLLDVECEVWSFGRIPLAISGRCYHARIAGLTKDSCQFVCSRDGNGLEVRTLNGMNFLAVNGVQTLSHTYCNTIGDVDKLKSAGVSSLRLSPHDCDMVGISNAFRDRLDGKTDGEEAYSRVERACGDAIFSNGFLFGSAGNEMVPHF